MPRFACVCSYGGDGWEASRTRTHTSICLRTRGSTASQAEAVCNISDGVSLSLVFLLGTRTNHDVQSWSVAPLWNIAQSTFDGDRENFHGLRTRGMQTKRYEIHRSRRAGIFHFYAYGFVGCIPTYIWF